MSAIRNLSIVGLLAGIAAVGASTPGRAQTPVDHTTRVRTARVSEAPDHRDVVLHGITRASDRAELAFTVGGRLASREAELGQRVVAGQVLARVDSRGFQNGEKAADASVRDLEGRLAQLERDRARLERLSERHSVSDAELERVRTQEASIRASVAAAQANAGEASRQRREAVLVAPFDGVITAVRAEPGESAAPGQPILQLTGSAGLEVALEVPERVWAGLKTGSPARIELPAFDRTVPGRVVQVGQNTGVGGLFPVVVLLAEGSPDLAAGLTARVTLPVPVHERLSVPVQAVVDPTGSGAVVFRVTDGVAHAVSVETGTLLGDAVAIVGNLEPSDEVVVAGLGRLLDGDVVDVMP